MHRIWWYLAGALVCWALKNAVAIESQRLVAWTRSQTVTRADEIQNGVYWIVSGLCLCGCVAFVSLALNRYVAMRRVRAARDLV